MRKKIAAALFIALIAGPALAQEDHVQKYREELPDKTPAQREADKQAARAYQRSLNNVPDQKQTDPWGIARGDDTKKSAAPAKPAMKSSKAKTGGSTN